MIVCINCKPETKAKIDDLLAKNLYRDYSELIATAIDSLWILEQEVAEKGTLVIGEQSALPTELAASPSKETPKPSKTSKSMSAPIPLNMSPKNSPSPVTSARLFIPELFLADGLDSLSVTTVDVPAIGKLEEPFTLDCWLFGQYNKLLPIKANCRALLRIAAESPDGPSLEQVASQIAEAGAQLGDYLANHDRRYQIQRDDALATAFPRSGPEADKSRARYANQFVGGVNSQGDLSGMLWEYRMAALALGAGARLMPTEPAVQFSRLTNPVLDSCQTDPAQKFSPEETAFLLDHIREHVPVEAYAFRTLIRAIAEGAVTPDKLDEALRVHVPAETNRSLSPSFLTSQRSGALSRMADLGLIARERKGVRVSYIVTEQGQRLIESK